MAAFWRNLIHLLKLGWRFGLVLLVLGVSAYVSAPYLRGWYHYEAGQRALERRAFAEAREHAAVCLGAWPSGPRSRLLAARAARRSGFLVEAQQHLDACPPVPDILEERQLERLLLQAQRGHLADGFDLLIEQVRLDHPQSLAILEVLTWEWMRTFQLGEALQALEVWRERWPSDPEALVRHGWVDEHLLRKTEALDDYRQALALDPQRHPVRLRLAEILVSLHQGDEAAGHFEYLLQHLAEDPVILLGLARSRFQQSRLDEAEELLADLLARHPDIPAALGERGRLALARGQLDRAESWLRQAVAAQPHDRETVYNLIQCLERQGKHDQAEKYATRKRQIDDDQHRMSQLMQEVLRTPRSAPLRYEIGTLFLRNGFREDGLSWLKTALERDPSYQPARQALIREQGIGNREQGTGNREQGTGNREQIKRE